MVISVRAVAGDGAAGVADLAAGYALQDAYDAAFNALDADRGAAVFTEVCEYVDQTLGRLVRGHRELRTFVAETAALSPSDSPT